MEMEDLSFIQNCEMSSMEDFTSEQLAVALGVDFPHTYLSDVFSYFPTFDPCSNAPLLDQESSHTSFETPMKKLKSGYSSNSCTTGNISSPEPSSSPNMLPFGHSISSTYDQQFYGSSHGTVKPRSEVVLVPPGIERLCSEVSGAHRTYENQQFVAKGGQGNKKGCSPSSNPACTRDHVIAERRRREKLSQQFTALSAIVPGLTKMDKASILEDSTKYLRQLQDRVKTLEDQSSKMALGSVAFVDKHQISSNNDSCLCDTNSNDFSNERLPEIEAKVSNRDVLIRIHCEKQQGILVRMLEETEKLKLSVINSSVIPFGTSALNITVMARMDEDCNLSSTDLVTTLRSACVV